jgi:hypothetical protein
MFSPSGRSTPTQAGTKCTSCRCQSLPLQPSRRLASNASSDKSEPEASDFSVFLVPSGLGLRKLQKR